MNPKITYALLGVIFVVMALIIVNQIIAEPELDTEIVTTTPQPEAPAPEKPAETAKPATAERQPMKEPTAESKPAAVQQTAATGDMQTPPGEKPAVAPAAVKSDAPAEATQAAGTEKAPAATKPESETAAAKPETTAAGSETAAAPEQPAEPAETAQAASSETTQQTTEKPAESTPPESLKEVASTMTNPAPGYDPIKPQELKHENILRLVTVEQRGGSMILKLQADDPIGRYKYFTLNEPSRLVVDLIGEWEQKSPGVRMPENELFRRVRFGRHDNKLRIVADLATTSYTEPVVVQDPPTELVVSLRKK